MNNHTIFFDTQVNSWALMGDVDGWEMPLHYGSQLKEHNIVRQTAGMFDLSNLGILDLKGKDSKKLLSALLTADIDKLHMPGKYLYSCILNKEGGIIDYVMVLYLSTDYYRIITDAQCTSNVESLFSKFRKKIAITITNRSDLAIIGVQGPYAIDRAKKALDPVLMKMLDSMAINDCVECYGWLLARATFTGEDGVMIIVPTQLAVDCWRKLIAQDIVPVGAQAKESLRLEAGYNRYGIDMSEKSTPLEVNLGKTIAWEPSDRDFVGREKLEEQRQKGISRQLIAITMDNDTVLRRGQHLYHEGKQVGVVTSGAFSPYLKKSIAMVLINTPVESTYKVNIRGNMRDVVVTKLPFVKINQTRGII